MPGLKYAGGSAEKGFSSFLFFKLGIVGMKEKSWNQEVDEKKNALGRSGGAENPPKPVKSLCV